MKKLIIFLVIFGLLAGTSSGVVWDFMKLFQGSQMIPTGAPWISDDDYMYFGDGKDAGIKYDETTTDKAYVTGPWFFATAVGSGIEDVVTAATQKLYTASTLKQIVLTDPDPANITITLPDAATVKGVPIRVVITAAPGTYYTRINATGGDLVGGVAMLGGTGNANDQVTLVSNSSTAYADYHIVDITGTWAVCYGP